MLSIKEIAKRNLRRWLGISDPENATDITLTRKLTREEEIFLYKIISAGDSFDIENAFKQVYDKGFHFWTSKKDPAHPICKRHSGLPNVMVAKMHDIITECYEGIEIEDKEAAELWTEIEKAIKIDNKILNSIDDVIISGDAVLLIDLFEEKKGFPKVRIEDAQNISLIDPEDEEAGIVIMSHYFKDDKKYLLEERRTPGKIEWKLFEGDKEVSLSKLEETKRFESINPYVYGYFLNTEEGSELLSQASFKTYQFLKFRNSKKYKGRGASFLEAKIDAVDGLDLVVSSYAQNTILSWPRIFVPTTDIYQNEDGTANVDATIFNSFYAKPAFNSENMSSNTELLQGDLNATGYRDATTYWIEKILQGFMSCSTLGLNAIHYNSDDDIREREKDTLYTYNAIKKMIQSSIPDFVCDYIQFYNYKNNKNVFVDSEHIQIAMDEYSNPSFEVQVETVTKAKTGGIMSIEAAVNELHGSTKTDEWKEEEIERLKSEKAIQQTEFAEPEAENNDKKAVPQENKEKAVQ